MKRVCAKGIHLGRWIAAAVGLVMLALPGASRAAAPLNQLSKQEIADGWILLFDGETLFGWESYGEAKWRVADGTLVGEGDMEGFVRTTTEFCDFILRLQYRISADGNSGVFFRADAGPEPWYAGYEMQIDDGDWSNPTGSIYDISTARHPGDKLVTAVEKWQDVELRAKGDHITVTLNGHKVVDMHDTQYARGFIHLQHYPRDMKVEFRNIRLKPLGLKSVFNGKDLTGWKIIPGHRSKFSAQPGGILNIKDGNGQIETEGQWKDFVLQLDIISNGEHLNSGVFFRGDPGKFWSGYESQIRNQWRGDDRTKPVDFGTGGVYGRQPARKVVSSDREWFTKTVIAHGNHMTVWINGYQVSDFTDTRPTGMNARKQCRLEGGTISLQGHDPTTDLSFRNIKVVEYAAARAP